MDFYIGHFGIDLNYLHKYICSSQSHHTPIVFCSAIINIISSLFPIQCHLTDFCQPFPYTTSSHEFLSTFSLYNVVSRTSVNVFPRLPCKYLQLRVALQAPTPISPDPSVGKTSIRGNTLTNFFHFLVLAFLRSGKCVSKGFHWVDGDTGCRVLTELGCSVLT